MIWDLISQPEKSFQYGPAGPPAFRGWKGETEPKEEVKGAWSVGWEHIVVERVEMGWEDLCQVQQALRTDHGM